MIEVVLVDEANNMIGIGEKLEVHRAGQRHRAISVMLFDRKGRILLQKRAHEKYHSGGLWANACCSHPLPGEVAIDAAVRRLGEEIGVTCELDYRFDRSYVATVSQDMVENEYVIFFSGYFNGNLELNSDEVCEYKWLTPVEIDRLMMNQKSLFAKWFQIYWTEHRELWESIAREPNQGKKM